jgi:hypothetical protein
MQQARGDDYRICQLKPNAETFGAVIDFLARVKPFSEFYAGRLASAVRDQLHRQHHVCAMRGNTLIGYCGWVLFAEEAGERWLREQVPFDPVPDERADAGALTIVRVEDPKVLRRLIRKTRELNPGRRVFLRRQYGEADKAIRHTSVLNYAPGAGKASAMPAQQGSSGAGAKS